MASNKLVVLLKKSSKDVVAGGRISFIDSVPILIKLLSVSLVALRMVAD